MKSRIEVMFKDTNEVNGKGYKSLPFYIQSEIIYDFTVEFCDQYIDKRSRTHDQTCPQCLRIAQAGGWSRRVGVARGSLEELLNDYQDFFEAKRTEAMGERLVGLQNSQRAGL